MVFDFPEKIRMEEKVNEAKELEIFLNCLFGKQSQSSMIGEGRIFRRKIAKYWSIWVLPLKVEERKNVVF